MECIDTVLTYHPNQGVSFGDAFLLWGTLRRQTRDLLNAKFEVEDIVAEYNSDESSQYLTQRRDVYKNYLALDNFFFLNFDSDNRLTEVEIHYGFSIDIKSVIVDFSMEIEKVAFLLDSVSGDKIQRSSDEFFFEKLKLMIVSDKALGGESGRLSYFYCGADVRHLI